MSSWFRVATLATVMRAPVVVVAPMVHHISSSGEISEQWVGASIGASLFCFAVGSAAVPILARRWDVQGLIRLCLLVSAIGIVLRSVGGVVTFVVGSLSIGMAIGVLNVVMPGYADRHAGRRRHGPGALTFGLNVGAIGSVLLVSVLLPYIDSWRLIACVPLVFLAMAWLLPEIHGRTGPSVRLGRRGSGKLGSRSTVLLVAAFMGMQACGFYIFLTWMPFALTEAGTSATLAGLVVAANQIGQVGLVVVMASCVPAARQTAVYLGCVVVGTVGGLSIVDASAWLVPVVGVLFGLAHGAALSLAFHLIADKSADAAITDRMSTVAHVLGYAMAAVAPAVVGVIAERDDLVTILVIVNAAIAAVLVAIAVLLQHRPAVAAANRRGPRG